MIKLEDFQEIGFSITWKLINIGLKGSRIFRNELSTADIINYAISKMDSQSEDTDIVDLACEYDNNVDEISKYVNKLADKESTEYCVEFRKWRVVYVSKQLPKLEMDFINGLIALGDIWAKFDFPQDSPHVFQGVNNNITPEQYYTLKNYNYLLHKHIEWISNEIEIINASAHRE